MKGPQTPNKNNGDKRNFLQGLVICMPETTKFPHSTTIKKVFETSVPRCGGVFTDVNRKGVTHILVGVDGIVQPLMRQSSQCALEGGQIYFVDYSWLQQSLRQGKILPESQFPPQQAKASYSSTSSAGTKRSFDDVNTSEVSSDEVLIRRKWLGEEFWTDKCASMSLTELALQPVYNDERSRQIGNEYIVEKLTELYRYERALHQDYFEHPDKVGETINHRALRYNRAASIVRACSFKLQANLKELSALPFIGSATAYQISDIIQTGTNDTLEAFRSDQEVIDSRGKIRSDTRGGHTREMFFKLPGVGQSTAKLWYDLGMRTYEAVEAAAVVGGLLDPNGPRHQAITTEQLFSLQNREDFLEGCSTQDIQEMIKVVEEGLERIGGQHGTSEGWRLHVVGGEARGKASHDADILVTNEIHGYPLDFEKNGFSAKEMKKVEHGSEESFSFGSAKNAENGGGAAFVQQLANYLIAKDCLLPGHKAMCRIQSGLLSDHIAKIKLEHLKDASAAPGYQTLDRFDHIYGVFKTTRGKYRRMDVILCPPEEWGFAYLGWVGSRMYLRFQRQHAKDLGMFLNSHGLFLKDREVKQGTDDMETHEGSLLKSFMVPQERPPRIKQDDGMFEIGWPRGWERKREVKSEKDVFELLQIPYHEPKDRNCP